jgi:hypothetical protein
MVIPAAMAGEGNLEKGKNIWSEVELEFVSYRFDDTFLSPLSHYRYI